VLDLLNEPDQFAVILAPGTAVHNQKQQEEIPVLDRVQQAVKALGLVAAGLPNLPPERIILVVELDHVEQIRIVSQLCRKRLG
jgi:hypothetical protein